MYWSAVSRQIFFWHYFCFWVSMDLVQNLLIKIKKTVHGPGPWQGVHESGPWTRSKDVLPSPWLAWLAVFIFFPNAWSSMDPLFGPGPWTPGPCFVSPGRKSDLRALAGNYIGLYLTSSIQILPSGSLDKLQWWPDTNLHPAKLISQSVKYVTNYNT